MCLIALLCILFYHNEQLNASYILFDTPKSPKIISMYTDKKHNQKCHANSKLRATRLHLVILKKRSTSSPPPNSTLIPSRASFLSSLQLGALCANPSHPIRHFFISSSTMLMIPFEETLLDSMADSLLLSNSSRKTLIKRLGRPRRQRSVHFCLFLAP